MIDLSSDTATKPTAAMRRAIADAEVGDEQKGEDPTVNRLVAMVAALLGKEAALFLPGGTMCNGIAIKIHTRPGDAILLDRMAHILRSESGGAAFSSGVVLDQLDGDGGRFTSAQVAAAISPPDNLYVPPTTLLCLEQTHNFGGGSVWPLDQFRAVCDVAHSYGLAVHLDGARLLNAVVATGVPAREWTATCDSAWIDFTKGLGAPVGAVLAGSAAFIAEARRHKHIFGGALRQAGIVAAGCIYALDHHIERLAEDHAHAQLLADGLGDILGVRVANPVVATNMVFFDTSDAGLPPSAFLTRLEARGIRMGRIGTRIRAVTHLDVSRADVEAAISSTHSVVREYV